MTLKLPQLFHSGSVRPVRDPAPFPIPPSINQDRNLPWEDSRQAQREPNIGILVRHTHSSSRVQLPSRVQQKGASEIDDTDVAAALAFRDLPEGHCKEGAERISEALPYHGTDDARHKAPAASAIERAADEPVQGT